MPVSDCEVRDPRIRRTRQSLQKALGDLLARQPLDEISVQDIAQAAAVNRATFYDHYTDKFALFEAMVAGGFHSLLSERGLHFDRRCRSMVLQLILAVCDYLAQLHAGRDACVRIGAFRPLMDAALANSVRHILLPAFPESGDGSVETELPPELIVSVASWAIYAAAKEWLEQPNRPPATEIAPSILSLIDPILGLKASQGA